MIALDKSTAWENGCTHVIHPYADFSTFYLGGQPDQ
ncbi:hypothetical protein ROA7450_02831 [Roseovarius albus]|uniref:Uncharacterized protein n=1 Tax=Roseovarius albus TaxID=1247867 RepID=A0A1X6ZM01_9RHOB|nr:hypothetical protein ROA7450_02831 [Roseovarius albus]